EPTTARSPTPTGVATRCRPTASTDKSRCGAARQARTACRPPARSTTSASVPHLLPVTAPDLRPIKHSGKESLVSSTMSFRDLYLVAGTTFDRAAARAMVVRLCNEASPAELDQIDEGGWLADDDPAEFDQLDADGGLTDTVAA